MWPLTNFDKNLGKELQSKQNLNGNNILKKKCATLSLLSLVLTLQALSTSNSTDEEEYAGCSSQIQTTLSYVSLKVPRRIAALPQVVAAADRHKLSSNALNDVLASLIRECNGNVQDFILSTSSTLRARQLVRSKQFENIKQDFRKNLQTEFFTIHWDEKLLKEGSDFKPTEHIAILSSHGNEIKMLGTMNIQSGSGLNQANAMKEMLDEWEIGDLCVAMCFDTTAANTQWWK